jgi:hypothetical protein
VSAVNVRRGLWRLWIGVSAFWVGFWVWHYFTTYPRIIMFDGSHVTVLNPVDFLQVTEITIGIPIAVLGASLIVAWIFGILRDLWS